MFHASRARAGRRDYSTRTPVAGSDRGSDLNRRASQHFLRPRIRTRSDHLQAISSHRTPRSGGWHPPTREPAVWSPGGRRSGLTDLTSYIFPDLLEARPPCPSPPSGRPAFPPPPEPSLTSLGSGGRNALES